jgi:ferredoxin--NADP+ reductase
MTPDTQNNYLVAVIGAGPAGLYAARQLAKEGSSVVLINRDIKPGGLAEYGIFHNKHKMKAGLRKQFTKILADPKIHYYGNVSIGENGDLTLDDLRSLGFQAIMVAAGAQGTKWLGLPGEDLIGVYHAKDVVYHYNKLPPFSTREFHIGRRVAIIGVGNVMMDIAHWCIRDLKVDEVIAVARRGPAEVKFTKKEMQNLARNLDQSTLEAEIERVSDRMLAVDQDPEAAKAFILSAFPKALDPVSDTVFRFEFMTSPSRMLGDETGHVIGLEVDDTRLVLKDGVTKADRLGTKRVLDVQTVIFCIGDKVDEGFGLPVEWNEFVKHPEPRFPVNGASFEAYDPQAETPIEGVFVSGWSRKASTGLVGVARKDGEAGARAVLAYLADKPPIEDHQRVIAALEGQLSTSGKRIVNAADITHLNAVEGAEAERLGLIEYKMKSNAEMLAAITRPIPQ